MTTLPSERLETLDQLNTLAVRDLTEVWRGASSLDPPAFREYITAAVPDVVDPYAAASGDLGAAWYAESAPDLDYHPSAFGMPPAEKLAGSTSWALGASGDLALGRLAGVLQRAVFDANRETVIQNSRQESGSTWARHASGTACAFCRMMATRGAVYASQAAAVSVVGRGPSTRGSQPMGHRYHDRCRCTAVEVRPGQQYIPPGYVEQWEQEYINAVRATSGAGKYGAIDEKAVLAHMRASAAAARAPKPVVAAPKPTPKPTPPAAAAKPFDHIDDLDDLAAAADKAILDGDFDALDHLEAREAVLREQMAKREAKNAAAREQRAASAEAKRAAQNAEHDRLLAEGMDWEEATEKAFGITVERQRRDNAISVLRKNGHTGAGFDEVTRDAYKMVVHEEHLAAEHATNGYMLNRAHEAMDFDTRDLWKINEETARKYASDELLAYWDKHGRTTLDGYRQSWLNGEQGMSRGGDWLQ
ncbi:hypothetical protein AXA44_02645 [Rhodococcus sp. SC4]|nr:hypothetical protein AXA44_02645 [Rhodococcus sp. SC4]